MLETLDYTIRIGSTPTFLYFEMHDIAVAFFNFHLLTMNVDAKY